MNKNKNSKDSGSGFVHGERVANGGGKLRQFESLSIYRERLLIPDPTRVKKLRMLLMTPGGTVERSAVKLVSELPRGFADAFPALETNPECGGFLTNLLFHPEGSGWSGYQIFVHELIPPDAKLPRSFGINIYVDKNGAIRSVLVAHYNAFDPEPLPQNQLEWFPSDDHSLEAAAEKLAAAILLALEKNIGEKKADGSLSPPSRGRKR
jgi:hypothetical protein